MGRKRDDGSEVLSVYFHRGIAPVIREIAATLKISVSSSVYVCMWFGFWPLTQASRFASRLVRKRSRLTRTEDVWHAFDADCQTEGLPRVNRREFERAMAFVCLCRGIRIRVIYQRAHLVDCELLRR